MSEANHMNGLPPDFPRASEAFGEVVQIADGQWETLCPAHTDHKRSLWIKRGDRGLILACRAGCKSPEIIRAAGLEPKDLFPPRPPMEDRPKSRVVATYAYTDLQGRLLFQVQRTEPKGFRQRRKWREGDPPERNRNGWIYTTEGVERVLYRWREVAAAKCVVVVEGEKDADRVASLKLPNTAATTAPMGAGKWQPQYTEALRGKAVAILPDNDGPGMNHAREVASELQGKAASVRIVELPGLPPKGDVSDWLDAGGTAHGLRALIRGTAGGNVATPPAEAPLAAIDVLGLTAVALAPGPHATAAAERLFIHLKTKGVLA